MESTATPDAGAATQGPVYINWQTGQAGPDSSRAVVLRPQSLAVLRLLHDRAGTVVSKEDLMAAVWPGVAVTDDSLVQCITEIRKAIGDSERSLIKTLSKRGYLFALPPAQQAPPRSAGIDTPPAQPPGAGAAPVIRPAHRWAVLGWIGAGALITFGLMVLPLSSYQGQRPAELPTIAVLPFVNLGSDPKGDKFAAMLTEDVITDLSHSKDFAVIAHSTAEVYKGKPLDIRALNRNLHVNYVLDGSVEALPGRVRVTAQLIDAETNVHLWSERIERQGDDVFALEATITQRIAASITGHDKAASAAARNIIRRKPPSTWSAYDAYQAGLAISHEMSRDVLPEAEANFKKALALDPDFARAHVALAWVYFLKRLYGLTPPGEAIAAMMQQAQTAVQLDPDDGEAHAALAQAYALTHDTARMDAETSRALALAPGNADILVITSVFLAQAGRSEEALANVNLALSLNPTYPYWYNTSLYVTLFYAGDFARSHAFAKEAYKAAPVNDDFIAMNAAMLGLEAEAAAARSRLAAVDPDWSAERLLTNFGALRGEKELARLVEAANKAGLRLCMTKDERAAERAAIEIPQCTVERAKG